MNDRWRRVARLKMEQQYHERSKQRQEYTGVLSKRTQTLINQLTEAANKNQSISANMDKLVKALAVQDEINKECYEFEEHPAMGKIRRWAKRVRELLPWRHEHV